MTHVNVPAIAQRAHPVVQIHDGKASTISFEVARVFGKRHDNVMRAIEKLRVEIGTDRLLNFEETVITRPNPSGGEPIKSPAYHLTRDGFTLLAMGFTGKRALAFKLAYIDAFNKMEAALQSPVQPPAQMLITQGVDQDVVDEIIRVTTGNLVHFLKARSKHIKWEEVIDALIDRNTSITFPGLTDLTHACLNRLQRNVNSEAYECISRRAANQGVSTMQVSMNA